MFAQLTSSPTTSARRAIPLSSRPDLAFRAIPYDGVDHWIAKDPVSLTYHRLRPEQFTILQALDGRKSLNDLLRILNVSFPALQWTIADIQRLVLELYRRGLVLSERAGQARAMVKKARKARNQQFWQVVKNLLSLRVPGWDPQNALDAILPFVSFLFRPWAVALTLLFVCSSWIVLGINFDQFRRTMPEFSQFFGWPNMVWLWATLAGSKILHEFGHGLSCRYFGAECHSMGVMLLVFSPALYCDTTDSWMLRNKWHRIIIAAAGMYVESILSAVAIIVWASTSPGWLHYLAINTFTVTAVSTIIFNANPLMRLDGYYMFSDWMEVPNLHQRASRALRDRLTRWGLGVRLPADPWAPAGENGWLALYSTLSAGYRWFVVIGIAVFLYSVLKPYGLQDWGLVTAWTGVIGSLWAIGHGVYSVITMPGRPPINQLRAGVSAVLLAGILALAALIPLPFFVQAACVLEPLDVEHVYVMSPGSLDQVLVRPGDQVAAGQLLASLTNRDLLLEQAKLQQQQQEALAQLSASRALEDISQLMLSEERQAGIQRQLDEIEKQLADLQLLAPAAGTVIEPPRKAVQHDEEHLQLASWAGTPLEPRNNGSFLEPQTHVLSIAPKDQLRAVLYVDQADREDLSVGQRVRIKFDHLPWQVFEGKIASFSARNADYAPQSLSNKLGGDLPTTTDDRGERLMSQAYQAVVELDEDPTLFKPGMRGQARCIVMQRTLVGWCWRWVKLTFNFHV